MAAAAATDSGASAAHWSRWRGSKRPARRVPQMAMAMACHGYMMLYGYGGSMFFTLCFFDVDVKRPFEYDECEEMMSYTC